MIEIDITDPDKPISGKQAHLHFLLNQVAIKIFAPDELPDNVIQKTVHWTINKAPILPFQIRRTYRRNDPVTGAIL